MGSAVVKTQTEVLPISCHEDSAKRVFVPGGCSAVPDGKIRAVVKLLKRNYVRSIYAPGGEVF